MPSGLSNMQAIYSTSYAFAALKQDGSVAIWGEWGSAPNAITNLRMLFGSTLYYSDSSSMHHYPCPYRYYGSGMPDCSACPSDLSENLKNDFSLGIRSVIGSCILCDQPTFSLDGQTCADSCADGYTYYPPTF